MVSEWGRAPRPGGRRTLGPGCAGAGPGHRRVNRARGRVGAAAGAQRSPPPREPLAEGPRETRRLGTKAETCVLLNSQGARRSWAGSDPSPEGAEEQLKAFDNEVNAFLDNMFGPRDSRVRGWFLLDSYLPTFILTLLYLLSIWLGNKYMKNRPALSLRGILTLYNLGITLLSAYMLVELILSSWEGGYNLQCQNLDSAGEGDVRVAKVLWWYYFSKLVEFLDTIFFVLRKKTNQITFLHVYHHASMFNIWWCVLNWIPCGQSFFGPTLNSFIHILMYSYYGLSVFPSMHKYLWWKKYLTQAQLVQFVLTITHTLSAVVKPCGFPFGCLIFQSSYMMTLVILFLNFYIQTYRKKPAKKELQEQPAGKEVKNGFPKARFMANGMMDKKAQ
ncbi:elongation of very long chain fatty acids protein 2 [Apodemus sylvaticus]|uniref:elongation of very long chain fatty acids protein 2 n=1 Tax=Apodemus sylvaticus TaxID=10129 RepID=UPI0022446BFC|nr:elongation of very long chain fatty acids protein 2 [Apodemus sylvaticus]